MRTLTLATAVLLGAGLLAAQTQPVPQNNAPSPLNPQHQPGAPPALPTSDTHLRPGPAQTVLKEIHSFDKAAMDTTADPCADFYQYACGTWIKTNPIPPDQSRWGRFNELAEHNREILRNILEDAALDDPNRSPIQHLYGDFYASCMDETAANRKGYEPIKPTLQQIDGLSDKAQITDIVLTLDRDQGIESAFDFGSQPDFKDATHMIAAVDQGGLGLPDRDYYLKTDPKSVETRKQYVEHVTNMFKLIGDTPEQAAAEAKNVMALETALAQGSMARVERRTPANVYHPMSTAELERLAPSFGWRKFIADVGAPQFTSLNVASPGFFKALNEQLDTAPLAAWKSYLRWHLVHSDAPRLSDAFVNEDFNFYGKELSGQKELQPRWKRCVSLTDRELGEAVGQEYVRRAFGPDAKQSMLQLVHNVEGSLGQDIENLSWMTDPTKKQAEIKLDAITNKIGYPDKWRDYSSVKVVRTDLVSNLNQTRAFEFHRQANKIGKPLDKTEWDMTPPTVNAYYDPSENDINFPAGILQPPFYDKQIDDPVNYGGIGVVIGHELTHGFDDEGSQFDAQGNLRDWWSPADKKAFDERTQCIVDEYSQFEPVPGVHLNGKLTLGENTADNGGLRVSYAAMMKALQEKGIDPNKKIDGFTPAQRYFIGFAQVWCENRTEQIARLSATVDPHSPGRFRANGSVRNFDEFGKAFGCKQGSPMMPAHACQVW